MAYHPIEDYGIIGDLRTAALVSSEGSVDFLPFPRLDGPTVFGALLDDADGGRFEISAAMDGARRKQLYLPDTNVLLTRFLSDAGVGEITDFMPVTVDAPALVRRVTCVRGPLTFRMRCRPRFDYGRAHHTVELDDRAAVFTAADDGGTRLVLHAPVELETDGGQVHAEFTLEAGQHVDFVLTGAGDAPGVPPDDVDAALTATIAYWRDWLGASDYRGRWRDMVNRSALAMKLLTHAATGSIAAAATFGLPEEIGGERNWDYRFTWIRDASFTTVCLIRLGFRDEASRFLDFVAQRYQEAAGSDSTGALQIMYGLDGRHDLTEQVLENLEGYRGSGPVRIGNGAYTQTQLDIYGELLLAVDAFDEHVEPVAFELWQDLSASVEWVTAHWRDTDEGIWEVRGGRREFLYSRLMDWVAMDRAVRIAQRRSLPAPIEKWRATRDEIHGEIHRRFWSDDKQAFVQYAGGDTLDASALMMPLVGFIAPRDPRWLSTLERIGRELVDDALVYRYHPEAAASDGLEGSEGTFCMCSYWYVECLALAGDVDRARLLFEKMHGYANHLGLYAEEMDPAGRYLGNFPQAFTHLGLVNAALSLGERLDRGLPAAARTHV